MKEKYYVLNSCGYESYQPVWFKSTKSKVAFKGAVKESIHESVVDMIKEKYDGYIDGTDLLRRAVSYVEGKGFEKLTPHLELSVEGECLYRKGRCQRRPTIIPKEDWLSILAHNKMIETELYSDEDDGRELEDEADESN